MSDRVSDRLSPNLSGDIYPTEPSTIPEAVPSSETEAVSAVLQQLPRNQFGQPKIQDLDYVVPDDEQILGLQIPMDDAFLVRRQPDRSPFQSQFE
jgi:hypothetical protein